MKDLKYRQDIIKDKRKNTDFRDYIKEITSRCPLVFHKHNGFVSRYPKSNRIKKVISNNEFNKVRDNLINIGRIYNTKISFFNQFKEFIKDIPLSATIQQLENENTDFADSMIGGKNCYLSYIVVEDCMNIMYSFLVVTKCKNVYNSLMVVENCDNIYYSIGIFNSYNIFYSKYIQNSSNIRFSSNMTGCHDCIFCDNLENKSYYIKNKQYSKNEFIIEKNKLLKEKNNYEVNMFSVNTKATNQVCNNCNGNAINFSSNVNNGYYINRLENGNNVMFVSGIDGEKHMYDCFDTGVSSSDFYGVEGAGTYSNNIYLSSQVEKSSNIYYSYYLNTCSYCIGCIGLKNKSFCILNRQYSKDERFQLADKIFEQMDKDGILGDFFPGSMNPFYFNDTAAYLIDDSFTKEEVESEGYLRRDDEIKVDIPENADIINSENLKDFQSYDKNGNWIIDKEILKKVIKDKKGNYYKIVKMEYNFLMKHGLPLPETHWLDRIKLGFKFK